MIYIRQPLELIELVKYKYMKYQILILVVVMGLLVTNTNLLAAVNQPVKTVKVKKTLLWGAFIGDAANNDLTNFESLVGKKMNYYVKFESWQNNFPSELVTNIGKQKKTLVIFWEPSFGYDNIINKSQDTYIKKFAADAKAYGYPVILVPFPEMNLNEEAWGYGQSNNTAAKFKLAWKHVHSLFAKSSNVKFGLAYNRVSLPDVSGNKFRDYYPGSAYVNYLGVDGFNFSDPGNNFAQTFDKPMKELSIYNKPIIIFSMATVAGPSKANWIKTGLGSQVKTYKNLVGWIWFNQGGSPNWLIDSDPSSFQAFKNVLP